mgnify:CR=1 FL=1
MSQSISYIGYSDFFCVDEIHYNHQNKHTNILSYTDETIAKLMKMIFIQWVIISITFCNEKNTH